MIDQESVIRQLTQHIARAENIENDWMDCVSIPMLRGALELLKTKQYYLQNLEERLQLIADIAYDFDKHRISKQLTELVNEMRDIAIRGFPEVKDD